MATVNVTTANTFEEWRVKTNQVGTAVGNLTNLTEANTRGTDVIGALTDISTNLATAETTIAAIAATYVDVAGDTMTGDLNFADNADVNFGAGTDLKIYHDGSHSYITDGGTGNLKITASQLDILGTSETMATFVDDGAVTLYNNNAIKFATTATGTSITGNVIATGTVEPAGDTAAGDNAAIGYTAAEGLILTGQGSTNDITIKNDADAAVISIPTGTTNATVVGTLDAANLKIGGQALDDRFMTASTSGGTTTITDVTDFTNDITMSESLTLGSEKIYQSGVGGFTFLEYAQDLVGDMVSSNTESGITVTYQDGDGTLDFDVNDPVITLTGAVTGSATMTNLANVSIATAFAADTFVDTTGDTMTGTLITASSGLSGSTAGVSAATLLTLGTGSSTAVKIDANQRIGIGGAVHASHKVDVSGRLNATNLSIGNTDISTVFVEAGEAFQDAVGAMLGGTETGGITVTYDDTNNHIDFAIADDGHNHVVGNIDAIQEYIEDTVGDMVSGNTETGITVTYDDGDGTLDFVVDIASIGNLNETVEDIIGSMVTGNTESGISVTYADNAAGAGKLNFDVSDPTITLTGDVTGSGTLTNLGSVSIATTRTAGSTSTADIADAAITLAKMAANSVDSDQYVDGSIDSVHIADGTIVEADMANDAISRAKLKDEVVLTITNSAGTVVKTLYGAGS